MSAGALNYHYIWLFYVVGDATRCGLLELQKYGKTRFTPIAVSVVVKGSIVQKSTLAARIVHSHDSPSQVQSPVRVRVPAQCVLDAPLGFPSRTSYIPSIDWGKKNQARKGALLPSPKNISTRKEKSHVPGGYRVGVSYTYRTTTSFRPSFLQHLSALFFIQSQHFTLPTLPF